LAGLPRREADARARHLLDALGVGALAARHPRELAGGEEQRVAVARALVHRPAVVLADEPTGSLDRDAGQAVARALTELVVANGSAALVATHDSRLEPLSTRHLHLRDGVLTGDSPEAGTLRH